MGKKYIIELEDEPFEKDGQQLWKSKEFNTMVFDEAGLSRLQEYCQNGPNVVSETWPCVGDTYYHIDSFGFVDDDCWTDSSPDHEAVTIGNVFRTKKEAEFMLEKLKVIHELKQFAEPKDAVWDSITLHYFISCDSIDGKLGISLTYTRSGAIYFATSDDARKAMRSVGEDRIKKYYLEVSDG